MNFAQRTDHLRPEGAYAVLARGQALEAQGREIIHLETGRPDFEAPSHLALAGIRAIACGQTRYNPPAGIALLRLLTDVELRAHVIPAARRKVHGQFDNASLIDEIARVYQEHGVNPRRDAAHLCGRGVQVQWLRELHGACRGNLVIAAGTIVEMLDVN